MYLFITDYIDYCIVFFFIVRAVVVTNPSMKFQQNKSNQYDRCKLSFNLINRLVCFIIKSSVRNCRNINSTYARRRKKISRKSFTLKKVLFIFHLHHHTTKK